MKRDEDFLYKVKLIREVLKEKEFDGIEIKSQANFSYVTRGRGFIGLASAVACGSIFITKEDIFLVSENIESKRLFNEQLNSNSLIKVLDFPWDEPAKRTDIVNEISKGLKIATEGDLEQELFKLRTVMSPYDYEEYKKLNKECAILIENICKGLKKGISEYELAGEISKQFWSNNIEPITILIGFDERALKRRHPVMTDNVLENYALVGICGRRNGLICSLSRDVLINSDTAMIEKHNKCAMVNAAFLSELKVGNTLSKVFQRGMTEYEKQGYPLEYKEHHQGGLTGFIPREIRANIDSTHIIRENETYAFNPTIQGSKCEDTVFVTKDSLEIMTYTGDYTYVSCKINNEIFVMPTVYVINNGGKNGKEKF